MFKLETKKTSIIVGAVASAIILSTFSVFAMDPTTVSLAEQTIGTSTEVFSDSLVNVVTDNSLPKIIFLNKPGDYKLIGSGNNDITPEDSNETVQLVKENDNIEISGDGIFNVVMEDVNININNNIPLKIINNAKVFLTLKGSNELGSTANYSSGIYLDDRSELTITESSQEASLDVHGADDGIYGRNITIKGGHIKSSGEQTGIHSQSPGICFPGGVLFNQNALLKIDGGTVETFGYQGISGENVIINNGKIIIDNKLNIDKEMIINNGEIIGKEIYSPQYLKITVNDGHLQVDKLSGTQVTINGGCVKAPNVDVIGNLTINGGKLKLRHINDNYWNKYIQTSEKIFCKFDNNGNLVARSKNKIDDTYTFTTSSTFNDLNFYITGGSINGIGFAQYDTIEN